MSQSAKKQFQQPASETVEPGDDETAALPELSMRIDRLQSSVDAKSGEPGQNRTEQKIDRLINIVESIDVRLAIIVEALSGQSKKSSGERN